MALHEMYTNAVKHGAPRETNGTVNFDWQVSNGAEPRLVMRWAESGSIPVQAPSRKGFGTTMIKQAPGAELEADINLDYSTDTLICTVTAPLPHKARTQ